MPAPSPRPTTRTALSLALTAVALSQAPVSAQQAPDAGRILNEIERARVPGLPPHPSAAPVIEEPTQPALSGPSSLQFRVSAFRITHTTVYTEAELLPLLRDFIDRDLSLADVNRAADVLTRYYRDHGHFVARAYVPAQEIKDGIVEIIVLEGRADRINVVPNGRTRLAEAVVRDTLSAALGAGGVLREEDLERGLLLLNDMPGVDVRATLSPGTTLGASTVTAQVSEGAPVSGEIDFDNGGSKFSGAERLGASINLNDPSGRGDQATLRATHSTGVDYGRLAYQIPVGHSGLKVGAAYASTRYKLCCDFAALEAHGTATVSSLSATYPFLRKRSYSLLGGIVFDDKKFFDATIAGPTSDRKARTVTLSLAGEGRDGLGGGGLTNAGIGIVAGDLILGAPDSRLAGTEGGYTKTTWSLTRLQRLGASTSLYASFSGQVAAKNLDSSEKLFLGGPQGVRAYPQGEAPGDEGSLLTLEVRYDWSPSLRLSAFVDQGSIRRHHDPSGLLAANEPNRYSLLGAGLGLQWSQPGDFVVSANLAQRLGSNPGRDANGNDSDATRDRARFWLQAVKYY